MLTKKQKELFVYLRDYISSNDISPSFEEMKKWNPDGYFLSNGPGDPEPLKSAQEVAKKIIEQNLPLFGICFTTALAAARCDQV